MKYFLLLLLLPSIAYADGCPGGFVGTLEADYPDGSKVFDHDNLQSITVTPYMITLSISGLTITFPRDALLASSVTNLDCTYSIVYNGDPIFHNGFEQ